MVTSCDTLGSANSFSLVYRVGRRFIIVNVHLIKIKCGVVSCLFIFGLVEFESGFECILYVFSILYYINENQ